MAVESILNQDLRVQVRYADLLYFKQWRTPPRIVSDYLLIYVQEGTFELTVNDQEYVVKQGHFAFVQPGVVHQIEAAVPVTILALHVDLFPTAYVEGEIPLVMPLEQGSPVEATAIQPSLAQFADLNIPVRVNPSRSDWMVKALGQVIEHWNRKNAFDLLQAQIRASEIMLELLKEHLTHEASEPKSSLDLSWVPAYMQYRLSESLSVEEMARKALISRSYFSMLFREQFGLAPHQYLLKLRLDYATELLQSTAMPLQDISDCCGFSSVHHFSKMYKSHCGFPPSQVRRRG